MYVSDTADMRCALQRRAVLPHQDVDPALSMYTQPLQQHFHYLKQALVNRMPSPDHNVKSVPSKQKGSQQAPSPKMPAVKEVAFNLQDFILNKVVQEVTSSSLSQEMCARSASEAKPATPSVRDSARSAAEGKSDIPSVREVADATTGKENYQSKDGKTNSLSPSVRHGLPAKNDGKRHICVLCGASFTFQTNLTRHQRKLHGKPYVRKGSTTDVKTVVLAQPQHVTTSPNP